MRFPASHGTSPCHSMPMPMPMSMLPMLLLLFVYITSCSHAFPSPVPKRSGVKAWNAPFVLHATEDFWASPEYNKDDTNKADNTNVNVNRYADPNYPDLEFVNYDDPEYQVDQGIGSDEFLPQDTDNDQEIERMREERRRKNDEYQFQTYFRDILQEGDAFHGEWRVYQVVYDLKDNDNNGGNNNDNDDNNDKAPMDFHHSRSRLPKLVPTTGEPLKVLSRAYKKIIQDPTDNDTTTQPSYDVSKERILHEEIVVEEESVTAARQKLSQSDTGSTTTGGALSLATYWPEEMTAFDFRGHQGIQCVGNAYTISTAVPLVQSTASTSTTSTQQGSCDGPFGEYRAEIGIQSDDSRFRIKLDYAVMETASWSPTGRDSNNNDDDDVSNNDQRSGARPPPLHLTSMTVCREQRNAWPCRDTHEALFGVAGAAGGLFDPPPVGGDDQASQYMMLDLVGRATVLFPYKLDQHEDNDNAGWVTTLDWTPGSMRYQVDRKIRSGKGLLGLRTLELTEIQSEDVDTYRPRDGGADMRQ